MKLKKNEAKRDRLRLTGILILSLLVITTGILLFVTTIRKGDIYGAILGLIISVTILAFALIVYKRGNKDLKEGFPIHDERSRRVLEKASSKAFYVTLYVLLGIGLLSDEMVTFRDVSQATGVAVGIMALLFLGFWIFYQRREI